jgi:hypothetical protein
MPFRAVDAAGSAIGERRRIGGVRASCSTCFRSSARAAARARPEPRRFRPGPGGRWSARRDRTRRPCGPGAGRSPSRPPPPRPTRQRARSRGARPRRGALERLDSRTECVHHRLVRLRRTELHDSVEPRPERPEQAALAQFLPVPDRAARAATRGSPTAGRSLPHSRGERFTGEDQRAAGRDVAVLPGKRLADRVEAAVHIDAVISVADSGVELRQIVTLVLDCLRNLGHPDVDGRGSCGGSRDHLTMLPNAARGCGPEPHKAGELLIQLEQRERGTRHLERRDVAATRQGPGTSPRSRRGPPSSCPRAACGARSARPEHRCV